LQNICARRYKATAGTFADYVFDNNYNRITLTELEKYIIKYKHLPGIPSQAEVMAEGSFNVDEITLKNLEKIEEIFLYIIDPLDVLSFDP